MKNKEINPSKRLTDRINKGVLRGADEDGDFEVFIINGQVMTVSQDEKFTRSKPLVADQSFNLMTL